MDLSSVIHIEELFEKIGGTFFAEPLLISEKLKTVKAFIFDWDGVFNNGTKRGSEASTFSETDSMGINLLRFSFWKLTGNLLPLAVITGRNNENAEFFGKREHFNAVYKGVLDKKEALDQFCKDHHIKTEEVAFVFDDVIDLKAASVCGLRICVRNSASPLFTQFAVKHNYCDYLTGHSGSSNGIREACELLIGLNGNFEEVVRSRMDFDADYQRYWELRGTVATKVV